MSVRGWLGLAFAFFIFLAACEADVPTPTPVATPPVAQLPVLPTAPVEAVPSLQLPSDVRPTGESLTLRIDPSQPRFSGSVAIDVVLQRAKKVLWLHGRDLRVSHVTVTPEGGAAIQATWAARDKSGVASLTLLTEAPSGKARIAIDYDAAFNAGLLGLYRTQQSGVSYAFTQFESIDARRAFPCFDEPGAKIPFSVSLLVPKDDVAVSNGPELDRVPGPDGTALVHFATTPPLPSYLVAFAVGPLDVVRAPDVPPTAVRAKPLPLRLFAAKGRGPELAFAAARAGKILTTLESYFGIAFPYDKLDLLAVPERRGAMENAGAITFEESGLLLDEKTASLPARQSFAYVVAHEAAHQWFGDLVTTAWWDDIWLNESFATWMGYKAVELWDPTLRASLSFSGDVHGSMAQDGLASARQIRQPIASTGDIENAFDSITYGKGGGVLAMFERWLGPEVFQRGVHDYLEAHKFGSATAADFVAALSAAAGKDVGTPLRTFLDQPGVPFLEEALSCDGKGGARVHVKQSRYLPIGSTGDARRTWQVPVCVRYGQKGATHEACALVTEPEADIPLDSCPDWAWPNAGGVGYYHLGLAKDDLKAIGKALPLLTPAEKIAYADSLEASLEKASTPMADVLAALPPLAADRDPEVESAASRIVQQARDWLYGDPLRPKIEAHIRHLFGPTATRLGWNAQKGEDSAQAKLRREVLFLLADVAEDPAVRAEAKRRGALYLGKDDKMHPEAVDPNLAYLSLAILGEDADSKTWETMLARLSNTDNPLSRSRLIGALSLARNPELAARARGLSLESGPLRHQEILATLGNQLIDPPLRDDAWVWLKTHFDELLAKVKDQDFGGIGLLGIAGGLCDEARATEAERLFAPRLGSIEGGARAGASTVENIRLCAAERGAQEASARAFFAKTAP
jgi:alanyl aminopeptidase